MRAVERTRLAAVATAALAIAAGGQSPTLAHRTVVLGRSVEGRAIVAVETGDPTAARRALVVGCIHGNECAGVAVARELIRAASPHGVDLWVVPNLNPDGAAAGTRGNAHGVDLNRNFPWRWLALGGLYFSGPRPLSEPESRLALRLIGRVRPSVTIWFHQHLDVVDDSTGSVAIERRFARVAGMRLATLTREPGSAVTWQAHCLPRSTPFVVELPAGTLTRAAAARLARAVLAAAAEAPPGRPDRRC